MLTVALLNVNNYQNAGELYVERMRSMLARHLTIPHTVEVFTEKDVSLAGWWGKLELVERRFPGWVLYLDLDVVLTDGIDAIVENAAYGDLHSENHRLWMRDDFSYSIISPRQDLDAETRTLLGGPGCCNSSVMIWWGGARINLGPIGPAMATMHGDQNVITAALWPHRIGLIDARSIQSYKYHASAIAIGDVAPIVVFHGEPKPHTLPNDPLIRDFWR